MAINKDSFIFLDSIRHTIDEPDPDLHGLFDFASIKKREVDEDRYQPYVDYIPGRDM